MVPSTDGKTMSPKLLRVMERAQKYPAAQFNSLAHLLDEDALARAFHRIRRDAAVGVDGITKAEYGKDLDANIRDLHSRLKSMKYRHQSVRRAHIPKTSNQTRPIGISCVEDKIVQGALRKVLEAIYEQDFMSCSYGFRPKRSAHGALKAVNGMMFREGMEWILEADIQSFFDSLDRAKLKRMLRIRVADGSLMRLVGKCLKAGVLDGEDFSTPEEGTVQGSIISPLMGNVYLHYSLDRWFEQMVMPRLRGRARLIRYCDDFVIGFTCKEDAELVLSWLTQRLAAFGLTLHPEKTRLIAMGRPSKGHLRQGNARTFDFLDFTMFWRRTRGGRWSFAMQTRKASFRKALRSIYEWCCRHRHLPRKEQHAALSRRLHGHYNYFGISGNFDALTQFLHRVRFFWLKWMRRRSQRGRRLTWKRFSNYLQAFPLPKPRIKVHIWSRSP